MKTRLVMIVALNVLMTYGNLSLADTGTPNRDEAIAALERIGAVFTFRGEDPVELIFAENNVTDRHLVHLMSMKKLEVVDFNAATLVTSRGIELLKNLPLLKTLNLGGTAVTDDDLEILSSMPRLETLHLWLTNVGDSGMRFIGEHRKLKTLNLWDTEISDAGLRALAGCKSLKTLCIGRTIDRQVVNLGGEGASLVPRITEAGVAALQTQLPDTKIYYWNAQSNAGGKTVLTNSDVDFSAILSKIKRVTEPKVVSIATRQQGQDWTRFLGPTGDSKSAEKITLSNWNRRRPKLVWQRSLFDSHGTCAVYQGRLFLMDRVGSENQLLCLHSETGEQLWSASSQTEYVDQVGYGNGPRCSPVVDGNRVYAYHADGVLQCISVTDGKLQWELDTAERFGVVQYFFGVGSTPTIEGDLLFAVVGGSTQKPSKQIHMDSLQGNGVGDCCPEQVHRRSRLRNH